MTKRNVTRREFVGGAAAAGAAVAFPWGTSSAEAAPAPPPSAPGKPITHNTHAIGYSDLNGRAGAFKLDILKAGDSWFLYMGHLWDRGWTILDVTNPKNPKVANFITGPDNTWTIQMVVQDGLMVTALEHFSVAWGADPNRPMDEGVLIWDVREDPVHPKLLSHWHTGGTGTHRNGYWGGRYVHLAAGMPGYQGNIYVILDINDPTNPVEAGRWWVPGQWVAGGETPRAGVGLHGPPYVVGNLVYIPYGAAGLIILDISDVTKPQLVGQLEYTPPFGGGIQTHTVVPMANGTYATLNGESAASHAMESLVHASIADISNPSSPRLVSVLPLPQVPPHFPFKDFAEKGGRFGPHNQNMLYSSPFVKRTDPLLYLTYFVGGLRIYDVSDPVAPKEVGYFIQPDPTHRYGPQPPDALVVQCEDVLVDTRDNVYITEKNQGIWILRYDGK